MIPRSRQKEIRRVAEEVLSKYNLTILPIDLKLICEKEKIYLKPLNTNEDGISGALIYESGEFCICYSTKINNAGFHNFTIAHELGHYFLDGHTDNIFAENNNHLSNSGMNSNDEHEEEADYFATQLLMPEDLFIEKINKSKEKGFDLIINISNLGKTSIISTAIRYAELSEDRFLVVVSKDNKIEYSILSKGFKKNNRLRALKKGESIPISSKTRKFNETIDNIIDGKEERSSSSLKEWLAEAPDIEMCEDIIGLGHYQKTLTILYENYNHKNIIDDYDEDDEIEDICDSLPSERWHKRDRNRW